jgi:teichuronic acid biosynthesis glycosyltransferase TuaG
MTRISSRAREEPKVSIVMPAFNSAKTVLDSVKSVIGQSFENWELLIVDDCSTDDTVARVQPLAREDSRIKILVLKQNSGSPAGPRNAGIRAAVGTHIAFLDADDLWAPQKLERQVAFMEEQGAILCCTGYDVVDAGQRSIGSFMPPRTTSYQELLRASTVGCLTAMFDARALGRRYFPSCGHEDYALWLSILREGNVVHGLQERLATYRLSSGSVSANKFRVLAFYFRIYNGQERFGPISSAVMCVRCAWVNRNKYGTLRRTSVTPPA